MNPIGELERLTAPFKTEAELFHSVEHVPPALVPEPYRELLVHSHHMTVTMEAFHGCRVEVQVLDSKSDGDVYSRMITLTKLGSESVVQFGIVRFDFRFVTDAVRDEILDMKTPLGRVLINHNVLRHIDLGAVLRIEAGPALAEIAQIRLAETTYGRLATIFCNQRPAVDLLEISVPLPTNQV